MARPKRFELLTPRFVVKGFKCRNRQAARGLCRKSKFLVAALSAPVSYQKRRHQNTTNMIDSQRKCSKNNEADRYPPAYSGLVAGSSAVRTNNEINSCSEPCLRSRWALAPSIGEVPSSSERAACIAPNAEKFDNQKPWAAFFPFCSPW